MSYTSSILDDRLAWASAHGVEMEELYGHNRALARLGFEVAVKAGMELIKRKIGNQASSRGGGRGRGQGKGEGGRRGRRLDLELDQYDEMDSEADERMANFGFTEDEVMELACQGVKPWDDDARVSVLVSVSLHQSDSHMIPGSGCSRRTQLALKEICNRTCR
jgi:hypothetical protein